MSWRPRLAAKPMRASWEWLAHPDTGLVSSAPDVCFQYPTPGLFPRLLTQRTSEASSWAAQLVDWPLGGWEACACLVREKVPPVPGYAYSGTVTPTLPNLCSKDFGLVAMPGDILREGTVLRSQGEMVGPHRGGRVSCA